MVRLNKNKLSDDLLSDLFSQLNSTMSKLDEDKLNLFLSDLLGDEERIMLAKRLAIAVMINEGHSLYKISETLKVSPTTAEKIKFRMSDGSFTNMLPTLQTHTNNYSSVLDIIESIITFGGIMPAYGQNYGYDRRNKRKK